jgi:hypothetical protein
LLITTLLLLLLLLLPLALQVGQFHALQQSVAQGGAECLQQLLAATKIKLFDWKLAAEHVQKTAYPDYRPRIWWEHQHGSRTARGLLCSWNQDESAPGRALAWALPQQQQELGHVLVPLDLAGVVTDLDLQQVRQLALQDWRAAGHGSWQLFWSDADDPLAQEWGEQGLPFNLQALPTGILHAAAAAAAPAEGAAPSPVAAAAAAAAAAAPPLPLPAGFNLQVVLPTVQQQQQELPGVLAAAQSEQQAVQMQPPPPTPALPLQPNLLLAPQQQQQGWVQDLELELQQQQQQLQQGLMQEIEQLLAQPPPPQLQLQLGPQHRGPVQSGPATPAALSEPMMLEPASETADHPLVQRELAAQTSDASTLMDQDLHQHLQQQQQLQQQQMQQPRQKRQKLNEQQDQPAAEQGAQVAATGVAAGHVLSARFDTVTGPAEDETGEAPWMDALLMEQRQQSVDLSLETLQALLKL